MAYELDLSSNFTLVYTIFDICLLRKYGGDARSIIPLESVYVKECLTYEEVPIYILD